MQLVVHVDGGARGNPGPAAAASVVCSASGEVIDTRSETLGRSTNNAAEYRAILLGLSVARGLGATEVDVRGDSELIAKQVNGEYKVRDAALRPLHTQVLAALHQFERWTLRAVPRADNREVDNLVNAALDVQERRSPT